MNSLTFYILTLCPQTGGIHNTNYILLCFTLIYIPSIAAYRRKTSRSPFDTTTTTRRVRKTRHKKKESSIDDDAYDEGNDADMNADADADADTDRDDRSWFDDLRNDEEFAEERDTDLVTGTPMDLETWSQSSALKNYTITIEKAISTTLMDLKVINFNKTWCTYVSKPETSKFENEAFIELVKKLCSGNYSEDNDVRLSLRHTLENRKVIDRLMEDIVVRLSENNNEKRKKLLNPKYKLSASNKFCYNRVMKSFKYFCFDIDANPYMQRYLKVLSNACRFPELDEEKIRDHIVEACESANNKLVGVV